MGVDNFQRLFELHCLEEALLDVWVADIYCHYALEHVILLPTTILGAVDFQFEFEMVLGCWENITDIDPPEKCSHYLSRLKVYVLAAHVFEEFMFYLLPFFRIEGGN